MYEDKIEERRVNDLKVLRETNSLFDSMSGLGKNSAPADPDRAVLLAVMRACGIRDAEIPDNFKTSEAFDVSLRSLGLLSSKVELEGRWWRHCGHPCLTRKEDGSIVALFPTAGGFRMLDASTGRKTGKMTSSSGLSKDALCVYRAMPAEIRTMKAFYRYAISLISRRDVLVSVLLCVAVVALSVLIPFANKEIFENVIPSGVPDGILPICGLLLGAGLSTKMLSLTRDLLLLRVKDKTNISLQSAIIDRLLSLPTTFFKKFSSGDLSARSLAANNVYQLITGQMISTAVMAIFSLLYILIAAIFAPELSWLVALVALVYILYTCLIFKTFGVRYAQTLPYKTLSRGFLYNAFTGIHKIKNNGAEVRAFGQFARRFSKSEVVSSDAPFIVKYQKAFSISLMSLSTTVAWIAAYRYGVSVSNYIAFMSAFGVMLTGFNEIQVLTHDFTQIGASVNLVRPVIEAESEVRNDCDSVSSLSGRVEVCNVSFKYSENGSPVLDNISLVIPAGQHIGIVGLSGCGKSTLMRLLTGLEKCTSGSIFYDAYDIDKVNLASFRKAIGYCPQRILIFPDTVKNNIKIGKPDATDEEIWEVAEIAALDEDIRNMKDGMDTVLGEGGKGLSGGQCQRILIARAILNRPSILFFDEATSALDNISQKKVTENIAKLKCTRVTIAHRLSAIEHCDRIIVLHEGHIVEDGSPQDLFDRKGFFYELCKRQTI